MNKIAMFIYIVLYTIIIIPISLICDVRRKIFPKFLEKLCNNIERKIGL